MIAEILQWIAIIVLVLFLLGCVLAVMVIPWAIWKVRKERTGKAAFPLHDYRGTLYHAGRTMYGMRYIQRADQ